MRVCGFNDRRLGVISGENGSELVTDVTHLVPASTAPADRFSALVERWVQIVAEIDEAVAAGDGFALGDVVLRAPQPAPRTLFAAPVNYRRHQAEMGGDAGVYAGADIKTIETYAGFVKASSSVIGTDEPIRLPFADRRFDHEAELGVVIGREARDVSREDALDYVFGYVPLLDITMRGEEDRSYRKSFDTFTPIGPAVVTADEVGDPGALAVHLTVNGETRQSANTADLIYDVPRLVELYSTAITLRPGDVIATGTPEGVGPIVPGDEIRLSVERVGVLTMQVRDGRRS